MAKQSGGVGVSGSKGKLSAALAGLPAGGAGGVAGDSDFLERFPVLHEFITATSDDAGAARKTATLMLFSEDGRFRAVLHERQHGLSLWRDADSVQGCFEGLETALASGRAEWRKDAKSRGR